MQNTKDVGILSELKVLTELVSLGCIVSQPYGDNAPYDFIVDINGRLIKVQVKTATEIENGSLRIPLVKRVGSKRIGRQKYSLLDVDAVIAYSKKYEEVFFIDLHKHNESEIFLRPKSTIKVKLNTMNIAEDFILRNIINKMF